MKLKGIVEDRTGARWRVVSIYALPDGETKYVCMHLSDTGLVYHSFTENQIRIPPPTFSDLLEGKKLNYDDDK